VPGDSSAKVIVRHSSEIWYSKINSGGSVEQSLFVAEVAHDHGRVDARFSRNGPDRGRLVSALRKLSLGSAQDAGP
jgi:hypothetical protein